MSILFSQKLRITVGIATALLVTLATSYLYTRSNAQNPPAEDNLSYSKLENSTLHKPQITLASNQATKRLSLSQENGRVGQQISSKNISKQGSYSSEKKSTLVSAAYPVIDELQNYKFSVYGSKLFSPGKLSSNKVNFNQNDLLTVLVNTRKYFQDHANEDPQILREGVFGKAVTVDDVLKTLDFMTSVLQEDIANNRETRLQDPDFINTNFRVIKWSAYNPQNPNQKRLRITKYAVFSHTGSHTKTSTYNTPIYSLKPNDTADKFYTKYTKQDVLSGIYEPGGKEEGKVQPLAYLTRHGLEEALMEGTILINFNDGSKAFFNVDKNNEMSYIPGAAATEQKRYWYFKQVDAIKGYGYNIDAKISILPGVTFAGDVLNIGLGKVVILESTTNGHKHMQMGVIADTGGAFLPNLHQLDFLAGVFHDKKDFDQHTEQLPDYATAYILVKK